jgi:Uma2 family endonuclease
MDDHGGSLLARFPSVPRRLLTADEYHRMEEAGILHEDDRVELVEGELVAMAPIGSAHADTVNILSRLLILSVGDRGVVAIQNPIRLDARNEPQPDFAVVRSRPDGYRSALPGPDDVLLIIEVADSSLDYDRGPKRALYARHNITELWIVSLAAGEVEVHRSPVGENYTAVTRVGASETLEIAALPGIKIPAAALFGISLSQAATGIVGDAEQ